MPTGRHLRPEGHHEEKEETHQETVQEAPKAKPKYLPYTGKDSLPSYTRTGSGKKTKVILGEPRYTIARSVTGQYKLLAWQRSPAGVERRVVATFKPKDRQRPADGALLANLKKAGIPGAF